MKPMLNISVILTLIILGFFINGRNFTNKIFRFMYFFWLLVLLLSELNLAELFPVEYYVNFLYLIFVFFYFLGFFLKNTYSEKRYDRNLFEILLLSANKLNNSSNLKIFSIFFLLILSYYFFRFYTLYLSFDDLADVRTSRFAVGGLFTNGYSVAIYNYFISSSIYFFKFILTFSLVFGIKKYKYFFIFGLIASLMYYFIGGGRTLVIDIIFMYFLFNLMKRFFDLQANYLKDFFMSLIFFFMFVMGTYLRVSKEKINFSSFKLLASESFNQIIIYITGSFRALDYALNNYDNFLYGFGIFTFSSLEDILYSLLAVLGFSIAPYSYTWGSILGEPILIGNNQEFNALYTGLFPFYFDFGIFGVITYSLLLGYITRKLILYFFLKNNIYSLMLLVALIQISFFMFMKFRLDSSLLIAISVIYYLSRSKHRSFN